jgi:serine/threonine protein kinase
MPLPTGQILNNRYRIVKLLGQGGMGAVYRAWDTRLDLPCALKENAETTPDAQRQFEREAKILARVNHPNLPHVTDHFILQDSRQYLVMDFVEGEDLQTMLERSGRPLPEAQVLPWIMQVCDALDYLHHQQPPIIHRDIKPANIKITPQGKAMLVDFGIAKTYTPGQGTTSGAKAVTPGYSPIEQYGGRGLTDARTDIYALGATLYTLLTAIEPPECTERAVRETLRPIRQINPAVRPEVESAIFQAMQMDADRRFQSAGQFKVALLAPSSPGARPAVPPTMVMPASLAPASLPQASALPLAPSLPLAVPQPVKARGIPAGILVAVGILLVLCALSVKLILPAIFTTPAPPTPIIDTPASVSGTVPTSVPTTWTIAAPTFTSAPEPTVIPPTSLPPPETFLPLPAQPIRSGTFALVSALSDQCVDVPNGTSDDIQLIQYGCHLNLNQAWRFSSLGDGSYEVSSLQSGSCLDVYYAGTGDGEMIYQAACHRGDNQRWEIVPLDDDAYSIKVRHSGKCLDVQGSSMDQGQPLVQNTCDRRESQRWRLAAIPLTQDDDYPPILEGVFTLTSVFSDQCMDVPNGQSEDIQLIQYGCHGNENQQWRFTHLGGSLYRLASQMTGSCLDVYYAGMGDGEMIYQAGCHDASNQMWDIRPFSDGSYQLMALHSSKCLAVQGNAADSPPGLVQKTCSGGESQRWVLASPSSFTYDLPASDPAGLTLAVRLGQRLTISASGSVSTHPGGTVSDCDQWTGPNGLPGCHYVNDVPRLNGLPFMSLIGKINSKWGLVGERNTYNITQNGFIFLTINDWGPGDSDGSFQVNISLESP